jgi:hypothetical protein
METLGNKNQPKSVFKYYCLVCDYGTCKKCNYDDHILSSKHKKNAAGNILESIGNTNQQKISPLNFCCENCLKEFKTRSGLWKHSKICNFEDNQTNNIIDNKDHLLFELLKQNKDTTDKEHNIIMMLIKENSEFKSMMLEQQNLMIEIVKNGTHNTTNTTHTNSHNKAFNLNFFLNETCKDAMNIMDFVDSIKLQLSDLEKVGDIGYIEGISNIIVKNLKELDVTQRPVHCTDKKRETMYVKDDDKWEKDEERLKLHKVVRKIACKNQNLIPKFKEEHPDCNKYHSKFSDQYNKIIVESMGGPGDNDFEKEEKIIKNISKQVFVEKDPN